MVSAGGVHPLRTPFFRIIPSPSERLRGFNELGYVLKVLLRNTLLGMLIAAIVLGALGYMLAGNEGLKNGIGWGAVLGDETRNFSPFLASKKVVVHSVHLCLFV